MNMKKALLFLIILAILTTFLPACGNRKDKSEESSLGKETGEKMEPVVFPITVKDAGNYEMTIEKKPERIVSLTLGTDEMLLSLVDPQRILSITKFSDDPEVSNVAEEAKAVEKRAETNAEQVISLEPDLVFTDTWADPNFVQQVRDAGIAVYQFKTPGSIEEQRDCIREIAYVVGEREKGEELVKWFDDKLKYVQDRLQNLKPEEKLSILFYDEFGYTAGKGTNFDSIAKHAGLVNAAAEAGIELWPQISKEKIVELDPDIILLPSWFYDKSNTVESFTESIKKDPALANVKAVKNNRLIVLPNQHMSAISQYVVLGVEDLAKAAYPELFE